MIWNFDKFDNNIALLDEYGKSVTYAELKEEGNVIANACDGKHLVFSMCENSIGSVIGYTAFVNNGIVPVLLNATLDKELLDNLMKTYKPRLIWVPSVQKSEYERYDVKEIYSSFEYSLLRTNYDT